MLVCILLVLSNSTVDAESNRRPQKKTEFGVGVKVGSGVHRYHGTCMFFQVFFASGSFFDGLHETGPPGEREFKKGTVVYRTFPDQLFVDVQATAWNCTGTTSPMGPSFGEGLMSAASLAANWKHENEKLKPARTLSTREQHKAHSLVWDYYLEISAGDVPLTEPLLIDVSLRQGTAQTRLLAGFQ